MSYVYSKCPECGIKLTGIDREKHGLSHWGVPFGHLDRLTNEEAKDRYNKLMEENY